MGIKKIQILVLPLLGFFLGLAIVLSFTSRYVVSELNTDEDTAAIKLIKSNIIKSNDLLKEDIEKLKEEYNSSTELIVSPVDLEILKDLRSRLSLESVAGDGVQLTLSERLLVDGAQSLGDTCLAVYIKDLKNLLALPDLDIKAMGINGNRIVYNSSINCIGDRLIVDYQKVIEPVRIEIIADAKVLKNILNTEKFLPMMWRDFDDGIINVEIRDKSEIVLEPYKGSIKFNFIKNYEG